MSIVRSLKSSTLTELFKLIEDESKSGRLIIETPISHSTAKRAGIYYVWFKEGSLIAISDCLNRKGLINLIAGRGWLSPLIVSRLRTLCPTNEPLGIYLRRMKLLTKERLSFVFQLQLHQVYQLFQLTSGRFRFDDFAEMPDRILTVPWLEMTGHQIKTTEVVMYALRLMDHGKKPSEHLPESNLALQRKSERPHLRLTTLERTLWKFADGKTSLIEIAQLINQPIQIVKITAFRLLAVGLVNDVVQSTYDWEKSSHQQNFYTRSDPNYLDNKQLSTSSTSWLQSLRITFKKWTPKKEL